MDKIAFLIGDVTLYWYSIILALAAATAICFFLGFSVIHGGGVVRSCLIVPAALLLSLLLSRLVHWYSRSDSYASFAAAMTDYTCGSFALLGAFAGCLTAAGLLRLLRIVRDLPRTLDAMSLAAAAGISLGRLACFYSAADRGQLISSTTELPWVYPVYNAVSGAVEYRLATFLLQSAAAGIIFLILLMFACTRERNGEKKAPGEIALLFLLLYCPSQILLDSTRYDSLFFRSNGFVSLVQVFSACALVLVIVFYSVRLIRTQGLLMSWLLVWLAIGGFLGGTGYMEYYVQRHGDRAAFAYSVMGFCLAAVVTLALILRTVTYRKKSRFLSADSDPAPVAAPEDSSEERPEDRPEDRALMAFLESLEDNEEAHSPQ